MKLSPYQTFACTGYDLEKITQEVQLEMVVDPWASMIDLGNQLGDRAYALFSNLKFNPKPFAHPIDIVRDKNRGDLKSDIVVVDTRPFTKVSKLHMFDVTKHAENDLARRRAVLHAIWRDSDRYLIQNACSPLIQVYAAWISESISKHLNVDAFTQLKIANIAAWWFWCQSNTEEDLNENRRAKIHREISEATRCSYDTVEDDLNEIGYFDDLESFCNEVKERTDNSRIKHLDPASVIQLSTGGWIGTWSREIMSVAIEYPPYFVAVVYTAMHERGTRSALFAKFVQRFGGRPEMKGFKQAIERLSSTDTDENPTTRVLPY